MESERLKQVSLLTGCPQPIVGFSFRLKEIEGQFSTLDRLIVSSKDLELSTTIGKLLRLSFRRTVICFPLTLSGYH